MKVLTEIKLLLVQTVGDCNIFFTFSKHYASLGYFTDFRRQKKVILVLMTILLPCQVSFGRPDNEGHRLMSFHLVISLVVKKKTYASTVVVTKSEPLTD